MSIDKALFKHDEPHGIGDVHFAWQKGNSESFLATTGLDGSVAIFSRNGQLVERIVLQGLCGGFSWDCDGDLLGIITAQSSQVIIWDANTHKMQVIDTGLKDSLSCIFWSTSEKLMAVGSIRGNLAIYNYTQSKRIPILGKHSKRIVCGAWSAESILALGSDDKSFSLSNILGDSIRIVQLRDTPSDMYFAQMKNVEIITGENTVSMIVGKRTLLLYYIPEPDSPIELGFQTRYGSLIKHKWIGDSNILLGFSNGYIVAISTNPKDIGQELWQLKNHKTTLTDIAYCPVLDLMATSGNNTVKINNASNLNENERIINLPDNSTIQMIDWSYDGQILAITTAQGAVCTFVTKLQKMYSISFPRIAILSSISEVSIYHYITGMSNNIPKKLIIEVEPSFIAIGPCHLAVGMNNHAWFYDLGRNLSDIPILMGDREFISEIHKMQLNSTFSIALCGGHLILQSIESETETNQNKNTISFPDSIAGINSALITCMNITEEYLVFATDLGDIIYFSLSQWAVSVKFSHTMGIKNIFGASESVQVVFIDDQNQGYIFLPTTEESTLISEFPKSCLGIVWDLFQSNIFLAYTENLCIEYCYVRYSIKGRHAVKISETKLLSGQTPLFLYDGEVGVCSDSAIYSLIILSSHLNTPDKNTNEVIDTLLKLGKFDECLKFCDKISDENCLQQIGKKAIETMDIITALKVYKKIGDVSMVFALQEIQFVEDINILSGFCCLLLDKTDDAKISFAKSSNPEEALAVCRDLLQWEQAMILAETIAPDQIPFIAREYAQELETSGNYSDALYHYEKSYNEDLINEFSNKLVLNPTPDLKEHIRLCKAGIARTSIRMGDFRRGIQLALDVNEKQLFYDCAESLVIFGRTTEAAGLLEKGDYLEESCAHYIQLKMWKKVNNILPKITSTKLHIMYAKAKEAEGQYDEAIKSYKIGNDLDSIVRIYLDYLSDPHSAYEIVLESRSTEGSKLLSKFYQRLNDYEHAIQILVICGCIQEAFTLAEKHKKYKIYGEFLEQSDNVQTKDFKNLAQYFENEKYTLLAGKYYFLGREFSKSLKLLLKASTFNNDENIAISLAIDCVATSNNEQLANQLIDFLLGEIDGIPKDPKYLFRLYMARKRFKDAAKTAVVISNQEQIMGNYRSARDLLFSMHQELRKNNLSIASEMRYNLILLHRYTLVRIHVKIGNHLLAAKLLVQVAENISQFPSHIVPILTSTVIECSKAGLKKSAFIYASVLLRPEYRSQIDVKYVKKIEGIVRKAPKGIKDLKDDYENETSECPICNANLPKMDITCYQCKTILPICIATGEHIVKMNMTACPECDFPCFRPEMEKILLETNQCPMCGESYDSNKLLDSLDIRECISTMD